MRKRGTVLFFSDRKGFGFLKDDISGQEFYFHCTEILNDETYKTLDEGDQITFEIGENFKGLCAVKIKRIENE